MSIPTVEEISAAALGLVDDPLAGRFVPATQQWAWGLTYPTLIDCFLIYEISKLKKVTTYNLPANTTSLTPLTAGIADFGEVIELEERLNGSNDKYTHMDLVDKLDQSTATETLGDYEWRDDTFQFRGAVTDRQLRITYFGTGAAPVSGSVGIDGSLVALSTLMAGFMAPRKGDVELGKTLMTQAVGPQFDQGRLGGHMLRLIQPMIKTQQLSPVAARPYRAGVRSLVRLGSRFFVAANPLGTGTVLDLIISGTPSGTDGSDGLATFTLNYSPTFLELYKNGLRMTPNVSYTLSGNSVTFLAPQIPLVGDSLTASGQV